MYWSIIMMEVAEAVCIVVADADPPTSSKPANPSQLDGDWDQLLAVLREISAEDAEEVDPLPAIWRRPGRGIPVGRYLFFARA